MLIIYF